MTAAGAKPGFDRADRARSQALNAAQWLARLACSYRTLSEDEIQLRWNPAHGRIVTPEIAPGIAVGLTLPTLMLQFDEDGAPSPHPIDIDGKSSTEIEAWLLVELLHRGIDRNRFSTSLPYRPAHPMSGDEPKYAPLDLADELGRLAETYDAAAQTLGLVRDKVLPRRAETDGRSTTTKDLVCWPEHMDIGFVAPMVGDASAQHRIAVAFSGGDANDMRPRFIVRHTGRRDPVLYFEQVAKDEMGPLEVVDTLVEKVLASARNPTNV